MLWACRNDWLKVVILALAGALLLASFSGGGQVTPPPAEHLRSGEGWAAVESNALLIRRGLSAGAVVLALGTGMDVLLHRGLVEELMSPDSGVGDDAVAEELLALRAALKAELARRIPAGAERILHGLTQEKLLDSLRRAAFTDAPASFGIDEFRVEVGFATYSHWRTLVGADQGEEQRQEGERTVVLPQTKQAYVKLTFRVPLRASF
jgi:hypothetical protein